MAGTSLNRNESGYARGFHGCSSIIQYEVLDKLGEGTFGEVYKAESKRTGAVVALKKVLMHNEKDGFPVTAIREIKLLKMLSHVNVLRLVEMAVERPKGKERKKAIMYMVTPYMEHDLSGLLENPDVQFSEPQIKCYMLQLLEGLKYIHNSHILHRDMKAANLLISNRGILQIADFGLARHYDEAVPQAGRGSGEAKREYTMLVVTRWYRPPELLLQLRRYTTAIDLWGVGCVFAEMFRRTPILAGKTDLHQIQLIFDLVGSPTEENMPGWGLLPGCDGVVAFDQRQSTLAQQFRAQGSSAISLLSEFLKLDWRKRITAIDALNHPYFKNAPLPAKPGDLPTYDDSHELDRRKFRGQKAALPPAPAGGTVGMGAANGEWVGGPPAHHTNGAAHVNGPPSRDYRGSWAPNAGPQGGRSAGGGYDNRPAPAAVNDRAPQQYDSRRPPLPQAAPGPALAQTQAQAPAPRPGWQQQAPRNELPPRPPPIHNGTAEPTVNGRHTSSHRDIYVPSYRDREFDRDRPFGDNQPDRRDRDQFPNDRRDSYGRSNGGGYGEVRGGDDYYRRGDGGGNRRGSPQAGLQYGERERSHRRTRSRSPGDWRDRDRPRERDQERDRDRDRHRERERDLYRR